MKESARSKKPQDFPARPVVVHYHRTSGIYENAEIWVWDETDMKDPEGTLVAAEEEDSFGAVMRFDASLWGTAKGPARRIGLLPRIRHSWEFRDGPDRYFEPEQAREIWIVENDPRVYRSQPDVTPRVRNAFLDSPDKILIRLSHASPLENLSPVTLGIRDDEAGELRIRRVVPHNVADARTFTVTVQLADKVNLDHPRLTAHVEGYKPRAVFPREVMMEAGRFFCDKPLGALYTPAKTTFRLFSPPARRAFVVLYDDAEGDAGRREVELEPKGRGAWEGDVEGDLEGMHYAVRTDVLHDAPGIECVDPHAINTVGSDRRSRIADPRATDPPGFRPRRRPGKLRSPLDAVIYEMHVRDFTISPSSGVQRPGTYLGFVEGGRCCPHHPKVKTGIDHLRELGVTHVQLLPIQDFDNDETDPWYNWGYMTAFFNSPEGWYATSIRGDNRIRELKKMIQELHGAGIRVVLDVVYNHTGVQNTFETVAPNYYHRQHPDGTLWNGSGTGNEFRSEAPMARRFIVDSCRYWIEEFGVDGFRFDLMGLIDRETMLAVRDELRKISPELMIYGEPWAGGQSGLAHLTDKWAIRGTGIGAFNDIYRNAIKGEPEGGSPGYVQDGRGRDAIIRGLMGSIDEWTEIPEDTINYVTCHDNLTLWDKLAISSAEPEKERRKMHMMTFGILAVSQGILFMHGGCEMLRTKKGHPNTYDAGDEYNQIHWSWKHQNPDVFAFHRGMIALRREHPIFRLRTAEEIRTRLRFFHENLPVPESIIMHMNCKGVSGESWKEAVVLINPNPKPQKFSLPTMQILRVYVSGKRVETEPEEEASRVFTVAGRSMAVLAR